MSSPVLFGVKRQLKKIAHPAIRRLRPAPPLPTEPASVRWGADRGRPVDRHYIDGFIERTQQKDDARPDQHPRRPLRRAVADAVLRSHGLGD